LLKYLRDYKNTFSCKSIILTTLLGNQLDPAIAELQPGLYKDVPTTLNTLLQALAASLPTTMPAVLDPAGTGDNFSERYKDDWNYTNFRECIVSYAGKVKQALDETDRSRSIRLWQDIFGSGFAPGELAEAASLAPYSASIPCAGEKFIDQDPFGFPIRLDPKVRLRVSGWCIGLRVGNLTRKSGFRTFELARNGNRVPKNRSLQFTARLENLAAPYEVYWKVRNGGTEAADGRQLRGEISHGTGGSMTRTETTAYKGTHYVECYIVKDGFVVAKDRQTVVVT
jgi:hypothetical protein